MAGSGVTLYSTTASGNKAVIGTIDWREDVYMPSQINDNLAQIMADIRAMANAIGTGWIEIGDTTGTYTATYVSATSFRFDGVDVSAYYRAGMRVRVVAPTPGTLSGTITSSTFSTHTTLVVAWDSGSLSNEAITSVSLGIGSDSSTQVPTGAAGDCRFAYSTTTACLLSRYNGKHLTINGRNEVIPAAGVTLAVAGLTNAVTSYVYAFMSAGVMTLEGSVTVPVIDAASGMQIKTGDVTRTLVGMVFPSGGVFLDTAAVRLVSSYFNRRMLKFRATMSAASATTASTTAVQIADNVIQWLDWGDTPGELGYNGTAYNGTAGAQNTTALYVDSAQQDIYEASVSYVINFSNSIGRVMPMVAMTQGRHLAALYGFVNTGTGTWVGGSTHAACVQFGYTWG